MQRLLSKTRQHPDSGFTLIEILVVIAIIGLIVVVNIPNLQGQRVRTELKTAANELKSNLRLARTWSTAVRNGTSLAGSEFNHQLLAYGLRLEQDSQSYTLWEIWSNESEQPATFEQTEDARKEVFELPGRTFISSFTPTQPLATRLNVDFIIPHGTLDPGVLTLDSNQQVSIVLSSGTDTQTVTLQANGNVL